MHFVLSGKRFRNYLVKKRSRNYLVKKRYWTTTTTFQMIVFALMLAVLQTDLQCEPGHQPVAGGPRLHDGGRWPGRVLRKHLEIPCFRT